MLVGVGLQKSLQYARAALPNPTLVESLLIESFATLSGQTHFIRSNEVGACSRLLS